MSNVHIKGGAELNKFLQQLPAKIEQSVLRGALRAGASEQEVREALLLCVPYLGFPRVVAAFTQLQILLETRQKTPTRAE